MFNFLPKEFNFFDLMDKQVGFASDAAKAFKQIVSRGGVSEVDIEKLQDIEHQGDEVTHTILEQLDKTFITPIDREDIHALAKELDDIIDMTCTIASRMKIYRIDRVDKHLVEFAGVIEDSVKGVCSAVKGMRNMKNVKQIYMACIEVNRLENVGDKLRDKALQDLFDNQKDPIEIIKWKELYQEAETVLDICEDVTNVVESIVVKNA